METEAIMQTIEALHPEPALYGADPIERGRILMWEHRAEWEGFGAAEDATRPILERVLSRHEARRRIQHAEQVIRTLIETQRRTTQPILAHSRHERAFASV